MNIIAAPSRRCSSFLQQLPVWISSSSWQNKLLLYAIRGSDGRLVWSDVAGNQCARQVDGSSCTEASISLQEPCRLQDVPVSECIHLLCGSFAHAIEVHGASNATRRDHSVSAVPSPGEHAAATNLRLEYISTPSAHDRQHSSWPNP
jgi:hypothetical protein